MKHSLLIILNSILLLLCKRNFSRCTSNLYADCVIMHISEMEKLQTANGKKCTGLIAAIRMKKQVIQQRKKKVLLLRQQFGCMIFNISAFRQFSSLGCCAHCSLMSVRWAINFRRNQSLLKQFLIAECLDTHTDCPNMVTFAAVLQFPIGGWFICKICVCVVNKSVG